MSRFILRLLTRRVASLITLSILLSLATLPLSIILSPQPAFALGSPTISRIAPGNTYLEVHFVSVASAAQYQYSTDGGLSFTTRPRTAEGFIQTWSPLTIHGLENDRTYSVIIRALDGSGNPGSNSSAQSATPFPQSRNLGSGQAVLQGAYAEIGVRSTGGFGTSVSIGSNFHSYANTANCLGFRVDRQKNGWGDNTSRAVVSGSTFINVDDGDYFCPGSSYEGWSIKVGDNAFVYNNHTTAQYGGSVGSVVIGASSQSVTWGSGSTVNGISVMQNALVPNLGQSLHIDITLTNTTSSAISNVYYGRGYDPDNATGLSDGITNTYTSTNTITSIGGGSSAAVVRSTFASGAKIFLRSNDSRARAAIETSGFNGAPNPYEIWTGTGRFNQGGTSTSDQGVGVAVKIDSIAPGESTTFRISYVLTEEDASTPSVSTSSATGVGASTSATVNGTVNPNGSTTTVTFDYSTQSDMSSGSSVRSIESPLNGSANLAVSASLSGLSPGTTYYYRVRASNTSGEAVGEVRSFTPIADPTIQIDAATGIGEFSATINGFINPNGGTVGSTFFTIDTQSDFLSGGARTISASPGSVSGTTLTSFSATVGSLLGAVTYFFKLTGTNEASTQTSGTLSFTTTPAPVVTSGSATGRNVDSGSIVLNGSVNTFGTATGSLYFELSKSSSFTSGSSSFLPPTESFLAAGSTGVIPLSITATGIDVGVTYYYRLFAGNTSGTNYGVSRSFILSSAPTVTSGSASTSGTTATVRGIVNANGASTTSIRFYYATTSESIGSSTAYVSATPSSASGNTPTEFSATISGLTAGSTYFYRITATNSEGTNSGTTESFTLEAPDVTSPQATISVNSTASTTSNITVTINFDEATTGFSSAKLLLTGSSGGWAKDSATSSGSSYVVVLSPSGLTVAGNLILNVQAGAAQDTSGNLSLAATPVTITVSDSGASTFNITYFAGSASSGSAPSAGTYISGGSPYSIVSNTGSLSRTGYSFAGWNTLAGGTGVSYFAGSAYSTDANLSLYPILSANTYAINFYTGSATSGAVPASGSFTTGSTAYVIPGNTGSLDRTFCTFGGWNTQSGGGGVSYYAGSAYSTPANLGLYPIWTGCTTTPEAPINLLASSTGESTATISFGTSPSDGGLSITSYTFTSTPGSIIATSAGPTSATVTVSGLLPGTTYTFVGYATNNNGNSPNSTPSNSITTLSVGLTPSFGVLTPLRGGFTVSITNYDLSYTWDVSVGDGYVVVLGANGIITVTGIDNAGARTTLTVTTSRSGYSTKSASIQGASLASSPEIFILEKTSPSISITDSTVTCTCGEYEYVIKGLSQRTAVITASAFALYLDDRVAALAVYDPESQLASWLYPAVESTPISTSVSQMTASFLIPIDMRFSVARCEILVFERSATALSRTSNAFR